MEEVSADPERVINEAFLVRERLPELQVGRLQSCAPGRVQRRETAPATSFARVKWRLNKFARDSHAQCRHVKKLILWPE